MGIQKLKTLSAVLKKMRFLRLLQYLERNNINNFKQGETIREIDNYQTLINWVEFDLQPTVLSRIYKILIVHVQGYPPFAYVLSPSLKILKAKDQKIPHLYDHERFQLCLYYPHTNDYNYKEDIGEQFIPWIKLWLFYFEEWLGSGEWKGGGVEPNDEIDKKYNPKFKTKRDKSEKSLDSKTVFNQVENESKKIYDRRLKKLMKEQKNDE